MLSLCWLTNNSVHADFFVKETDTHQFLHFSSCHPYHTKKGIPYSQAVRLRRICSTEEFFQKRVSNLKSWLLARGYDEHLEKYIRENIPQEVPLKIVSSSQHTYL